MFRTIKTLMLLVPLAMSLIGCKGERNPLGVGDSSAYKIVFLRRDGRICVLENIYNPRVIEITQVSGNALPKWSPAGDRIAYISSCSDPVYAEGLFTIRPDGRESKLLAPISRPNEPLVRGLAWSPDAAKIAFVSSLNPTLPGEQNIWVIDADGQNMRQLTYGGFNLDPTWFPDGRELAFHKLGHGPGDTTDGNYAVDIMTGQIRRLRTGLPVFSPDGQFMAFIRKTTETAHELYFSDISMTSFIKLTHDYGLRVQIDPIGFTADGKKVIFASYLTFNFYLSNVEITEVEISGGNRKVLKKVENLARATLSPDRQKILLWIWRESQGIKSWMDLYILSTDGREYFKLIEEVRAPDWGPIH